MTRSAYDLDTPRDLDWRQRARCASDDVRPDDWHTDRDGGSRPVAKARHICLTHCPVLMACHADALRVEAYLRQSCVLGGVIYDMDGKPARFQRVDTHCPLCAPRPEPVHMTKRARNRRKAEA